MATRTLSVAGGNWDVTTTWAEAVVPIDGDDVVATGSSGNAVVNVITAKLNSFDLTGYVGTLSTGGGGGSVKVGPTLGTTVCKYAGTITGLQGLTLTPSSGATVNFTPGTMNGAGSIVMSGLGTISQQAAIDIAAAGGDITINTGTWNTNGFAITIHSQNNNNGAGNFNFTNSTITVDGNFICAAGMTVTSAGSTVSMTAASAFGIFNGGNSTYNIVNFAGNANTISGNNTFDTFNVNQAGRATGLKVTAGSSQSIITTFATNGSSGALAPILSTVAGSAFTMTKTGGNGWFAGTGSTNVSGNTGWTFTGPGANPTVSVDFMSIKDSTVLNPALSTFRPRMTLMGVG